MDTNYEKHTGIAEILKALGHPIRFCIVVNLLKDGETNVTKMQKCLQIPQSTLSQHLQTLKIAKLIEGTRNGLEINYHISDDNVKALIKAIVALKAE